MRHPQRTASAHAAWLAVFSLFILAGLVVLLYWIPDESSLPLTEDQPKRTGALVVLCAAGLSEPMEAVKTEYEKAFGSRVQVQYVSSGVALNQLKIKPAGDLFIPADDSFIRLARNANLIDEVLPLGHMQPVLAVKKGNPRKIKGLGDLKGVRLVLATPDTTAVGKLVRTALEKSGHWKDLDEKKRASKTTVNEVANDIKLGAADAGFVWDATVAQYPELEAVPVPELQGVTAHASAAVLRSTTQPQAALHFARFLAARNRGLQHFARAGFHTVDGDLWPEDDKRPELRLLAGAMLRPAIEETITAFEEREGVKVTRVYNGCGILVAQMKAGQHPDAYFACDKSFLKEVSDLFFDAVDVSTNQLVIAVRRDSEYEVTGLESLAQEGLKLGVGHEKQCALGVLTQETLNQARFRDPVMKNVKVQSPTGDMLVNQLLTGSLDAVIVYVSNTTAHADKLKTIKVDLPCATAVQPMAVGKDSTNKYLTARLMDAIRSRQSRERFEANGFHWQDGKK